MESDIEKHNRFTAAFELMDKMFELVHDDLDSRIKARELGACIALQLIKLKGLENTEANDLLQAFEIDTKLLATKDEDLLWWEPKKRA